MARLNADAQKTRHACSPTAHFRRTGASSDIFASTCPPRRKQALPAERGACRWPAPLVDPAVHAFRGALAAATMHSSRLGCEGLATRRLHAARVVQQRSSRPASRLGCSSSPASARSTAEATSSTQRTLDHLEKGGCGLRGAATLPACAAAAPLACRTARKFARFISCNAATACSLAAAPAPWRCQNAPSTGHRRGRDRCGLHRAILLPCTRPRPSR